MLFAQKHSLIEKIQKEKVLFLHFRSFYGSIVPKWKGGYLWLFCVSLVPVGVVSLFSDMFDDHFLWSFFFYEKEKGSVIHEERQIPPHEYPGADS